MNKTSKILLFISLFLFVSGFIYYFYAKACCENPNLVKHIDLTEEMMTPYEKSLKVEIENQQKREKFLKLFLILGGPIVILSSFFYYLNKRKNKKAR